MKVAELIEQLQAMPADAEVGVSDLYLFPDDIEFVKYEEIEGEKWAVIYS